MRVARTTKAAQRGASCGRSAAATAPLWGLGWSRPAAPLKAWLRASHRPSCCANLLGESWPAVRVASVVPTDLKGHPRLMPPVCVPLLADQLPQILQRGQCRHRTLDLLHLRLGEWTSPWLSLIIHAVLFGSCSPCIAGTLGKLSRRLSSMHQPNLLLQVSS